MQIVEVNIILHVPVLTAELMKSNGTRTRLAKQCIHVTTWRKNRILMSADIYNFQFAKQSRKYPLLFEIEISSE